MAKPKIQNEKCCQGMPANSHLEAYVSKEDFQNFDEIWSKFLPGLALLGSPRLESAWLALPAPRNNSPAAFGGLAARSAAAVVAGAGKASEADPKRGKPSKPRAGEKADPHNDDDDEVATTLRRGRLRADLGSMLGRK